MTKNHCIALAVSLFGAGFGFWYVPSKNGGWPITSNPVLFLIFFVAYVGVATYITGELSKDKKNALCKLCLIFAFVFPTFAFIVYKAASSN